MLWQNPIRNHPPPQHPINPVNYYNEFDRKTAAWLRELIKLGAIPNGDVDERSIVDVAASDLHGYTQCHFFAGIGGWSYALQLAGWPPDRPVWTGSCPCQPFSTAGQQKGFDDERHLWPAFFNLIRECRPEFVFGEQVASAIRHGWLDGISADLEGENYACGAAVLGAHSAGSPSRRQRLYWVAKSSGQRLEGFSRHGDNCNKPGRDQKEPGGSTAETNAARPQARSLDALPLLRGLPLHNTRDARGGLRMPADRRMADDSLRAWDKFDALPCEDGWRRIESGTFPLAHGVPARVGLLRGYGNAIVPQVAAEFICASIEALEDTITRHNTQTI